VATERLTAADGPQGDDWATAPMATCGADTDWPGQPCGSAPGHPGQHVPSRAAETPEERQRLQRRATDWMAYAMTSTAAALQELDNALPRAMEALTDDLDYAALAEQVAWLQAMKARLGQAEAFVARELGRMDSTPEVIELPDGRTATVDPHTGEFVVDATGGLVMEAIAKAQAVHGSAAPKVTALKPLGLSADDYCTSGPGPYSVQISAPEASTTTQEN